MNLHYMAICLFFSYIILKPRKLGVRPNPVFPFEMKTNPIITQDKLHFTVNLQNVALTLVQIHVLF